MTAYGTGSTECCTSIDEIVDEPIETASTICYGARDVSFSEWVTVTKYQQDRPGFEIIGTAALTLITVKKKKKMRGERKLRNWPLIREEAVIIDEIRYFMEKVHGSFRLQHKKKFPKPHRKEILRLGEAHYKVKTIFNLTANITPATIRQMLLCKGLVVKKISRITNQQHKCNDSHNAANKGVKRSIRGRKFNNN